MIEELERQRNYIRYVSERQKKYEHILENLDEDSPDRVIYLRAIEWWGTLKEESEKKIQRITEQQWN